MKTDVWMPLYWGDMLADTLHLNRGDFGSYLLLIGAYWRKGAPLEDDDQQLKQIARCQDGDWPRCRALMEQFFTVEDGEWKHKRIDRELSEAVENKRRQKDRTAAATAARTEKQNVTSNVTSDVTSNVTVSSGGGSGNRDVGENSVIPSQVGLDVAKNSQNSQKTNVTSNVTNNVTKNVTFTPSPSPSPSDQCVQGCVEPPPGFPKNEAEAKHAAAAIGCPPEFAVDTWTKAAGRGGRDAKDVPVRSWPHYLRTEWTYEQQRLAKEKTRNETKTNRPTYPRRADRNAGTANEGTAHLYANAAER